MSFSLLSSLGKSGFPSPGVRSCRLLLTHLLGGLRHSFEGDHPAFAPAAAGLCRKRRDEISDHSSFPEEILALSRAQRD